MERKWADDEESEWSKNLKEEMIRKAREKEDLIECNTPKLDSVKSCLHSHDVWSTKASMACLGEMYHSSICP